MNPKDSEIYPQLLYDHLLGSEQRGPGLLRRVEAIVTQQATPDGPTYRTGSIIPTGSQPSDSSRDSGFSERTFELLVATVQWMGAGIREDATTARNLLEYLAKHKLSDVDLLIGPSGRLAQARNRAHDLLGVITQANIDRVQELTTYLAGWIGDACEHAWEEAEADSSYGTVFVCGGCGLKRHEGRDGTWIAV